MKKSNVKLWVACGIFCLLCSLVSSWYAITFNDARLVTPMDFGSYTFQVRDLPMILSISLTCIYIFSLFVLLFLHIGKNNRQAGQANTTRKLNPKLGMLGFLGFLGFAGIWTYSMDGIVSPFAFFLFFGFFGFYYEGKMSGTFMDERFRENATRAQLKANKIALSIILISLVIFCQGRLGGKLEYTLIAIIVVLSLALALDIFLTEYLLYRYDCGDQVDGDEE